MKCKHGRTEASRCGVSLDGTTQERWRPTDCDVAVEQTTGEGGVGRYMYMLYGVMISMDGVSIINM